MTEENLNTYQFSSTLIELAKTRCSIKSSSSEMTDDEIAEVMRFVGSSAPDTVWADNKPVLGRIGISIMLSLTLYEFPDFYDRHELAQVN